MKPRVRFAPSPTGIPHIGNTRTALFNYLFTKHLNGQFILRIEDTDKERYVPESLGAIFKILKTVGIKWDEGPDIDGPHGPYQQSKRLDIYKDHAQMLVNKNAAYYCFCSKKRLEKLRQDQQKKGQLPKYDGHCRNLSKPEVEAKLKNNSTHVIRLKVPYTGKTSWRDLIQGNIEFENKLLDDQVLLKSDGYPTYHLAVVVDDHLMEITHILRGAEWISSTPKHILIYQVLDWQPPQIGHFSVILGTDKKKLSKRHGAKSILDYIADGYLPESLISFMAYLGWSYKDNSELLSQDQLIKLFDLEKVHKQNPIFDIKKLDYFNGKAIRSKTDDKLTSLIMPFIPKTWKVEEKELRLIVPLIKERLVTLKDIKSLAKFFFIAPKPNSNLLLKHADHSEAETIKYLSLSIRTISAIQPFNHQVLEKSLRDLVESISWKPRQAFMTLRIALTGQEATPPLFEIMEVIGKKEVLARLSYAQKLLS